MTRPGARQRAALPRPLDAVYLAGIACALTWGTALQLLLIPVVVLGLVVRARARVRTTAELS